MEVTSCDRERLHLCVGDLSSGRVALLIRDGADLQTRLCRGIRYQADDGLQRRQRIATPVQGELGEESVLDLVPLARPRRQVANVNCQPGAVRQRLQLSLPQPVAYTVTAATVRRDVQFGRARVARPA